jgi:hypothetical protein
VVAVVRRSSHILNVSIATLPSFAFLTTLFVRSGDQNDDILCFD